MAITRDQGDGGIRKMCFKGPNVQLVDKFWRANYNIVIMVNETDY